MHLALLPDPHPVPRHELRQPFFCDKASALHGDCAEFSLFDPLQGIPYPTVEPVYPVILCTSAGVSASGSVAQISRKSDFPIRGSGSFR